MKKPIKTLKIDAELHWKAKARAAEMRQTLTEFVEAALRASLDSHPKRDAEKS